jgi:DNA polymerase-3 subunit beta
MQFTISRETLLKPLQLVAGVVERRQSMPVLSNVLLVLKEGLLSLTGTDLEVELVGRILVTDEIESGEITVPARKLLDIIKSLPDNSVISFSLENQKVTVKSGRSRFTLASLPASEFPVVEDSPNTFEFDLQQKQLKRLIEAVAFSMAQQDVRYYLNGMLLEITTDYVRTVATDGHRLALCTLVMPTNCPASASRQSILPRKGVMELARFLTDTELTIGISLGNNHLRAQTPDFTFTTKLVDGKFPDYDRVLPRGGNNLICAERNELRQAFSRASILSNEKYRGVRLALEAGQLTLVANNPEQEEAEEIVSVDYDGSPFEIGFNVSYLVDVLNALSSDTVRISLADANSSALIENSEGSDAMYVVMPMRL